MNKKDDGSNPSIILPLSSDPTGTMRAEKRDGGDPESGNERGERAQSKGGEGEKKQNRRTLKRDLRLERNELGTQSVRANVSGRIHRKEKLDKSLHICDPVIGTLVRR